MSELRKAAINALETLETLTSEWRFVANYVHETIVNLHDVLNRPSWNNLTKQEILDALGVVEAEEGVFRIARAIEQKLKEKNL